MKIIKEDYVPSAENIARTLNNVQDSYSNLLSDLYSLSYYLEYNYPDSSKTIDIRINDLKEFGIDLQEDLDDITKEISTDDDIEESMKVIKEGVKNRSFKESTLTEKN